MRVRAQCASDVFGVVEGTVQQEKVYRWMSHPPCCQFCPHRVCVRFFFLLPKISSNFNVICTLCPRPPAAAAWVRARPRRYLGVRKEGSRWAAYITRPSVGSEKNLGVFDDEIDAAKLYDKYANVSAVNFTIYFTHHVHFLSFSGPICVRFAKRPAAVDSSKPPTTTRAIYSLQSKAQQSPPPLFFLFFSFTVCICIVLAAITYSSKRTVLRAWYAAVRAMRSDFW